jgi:hypothetical protein
MKSTGPLNVASDFRIKDKIIIHPNDGIDIDLMNFSYKIKIVSVLTSEKESFDGEIVLENNQKVGHILLGASFFQKIGRPDQIKLSISDDKKILFLVK